MPKVPEEVIEYLSENPNALEKLQKTIANEAAAKKWHAEMAEKRKNAPMVECGTYGCKTLRNAMDVMCVNCRADYEDDPDAYK